MPEIHTTQTALAGYLFEFAVDEGDNMAYVALKKIDPFGRHQGEAVPIYPIPLPEGQ